MTSVGKLESVARAAGVSVAICAAAIVTLPTNVSVVGMYWRHAKVKFTICAAE